MIIFILAAWIMLAIHLEYTCGQTIWNMHDACGTVISNSGAIGELHFDAEQLPTSLSGDSCKITITPLKLDNKNGMVLFYFTTFRFKDSCEKTNVSVIDGDSNNANIVNGLPRYICGTNTTLERADQFFSTSGMSLKIIYSANQDVVTRHETFVMKFVSYYTGSCSGTDVHACSNGHCVPDEYACSNNFNVCGDIDSNCVIDKLSEDGMSVVVNIFTVICVIVFIGFTIFGFCMVHRTGRGNSGCGCGCLREICECMCEVTGRCCGGIADTCSKCCRCTRHKCSTCGDSISAFKISCGEHCTECCQSIRNKCTLILETHNQDTNNRTTSDASEVTGSANVVVSQPSSVQIDNVSAVTTNINRSSSSDLSDSSDSDWDTDDATASNDHVTPSAPPVHNLTTEDPPPSYDEAVAPSYKDYIANKERYTKHKRTRKNVK